MRLLTPKEHDELAKKENDRQTRKVSQLNSEVDKLTIQFNNTKKEIADSETLLWKQHEKFRENLQREVDSLETKANSLRKEIELGFKPLELKELELGKIKNEIEVKTQSLREKEASLIYSEARLKENKSDLEVRESKLTKEKNDLEKRTEEIEDRENKFEIDRRGKERLLRDSQEKIRQYLEVERKKIREERAKLDK